MEQLIEFAKNTINRFYGNPWSGSEKKPIIEFARFSYKLMENGHIRAFAGNQLIFESSDNNIKFLQDYITKMFYVSVSMNHFIEHIKKIIKLPYTFINDYNNGLVILDYGIYSLVYNTRADNYYIESYSKKYYLPEFKLTRGCWIDVDLTTHKNIINKIPHQVNCDIKIALKD